jgi:23S rRNA G2069 N7-methylase RlmK/C1962 C5-methylase RlmI
MCKIQVNTNLMGNKRNARADIRKETYQGSNVTKRRNRRNKNKAKDKEAKKQARRDKRNYIHGKLEMSEEAARENDLKTQVNVIPSLKSGNYIRNREVRDKQGNKLKADKEILNRWKEFFKQIYAQQHATHMQSRGRRRKRHRDPKHRHGKNY